MEVKVLAISIDCKCLDIKKYQQENNPFRLRKFVNFDVLSDVMLYDN